MDFMDSGKVDQLRQGPQDQRESPVMGDQTFNHFLDPKSVLERKWLSRFKDVEGSLWVRFVESMD